MRQRHITTESWPIRGSFTISRGSKRSADVVCVTIEEDGFTGRGECVPYGRYGETRDSVTAAIASVPVAITREALADALPPGAARNALDCALWDLAAKKAGKPVWQLAGLRAPTPVTTAFTLSLDEPRAMATAAADAKEFPILKLKLGRDRIVETVTAIHHAAPDAKLIVDANEAWDIDLLAQVEPALCALNVCLIEQPLPAGNDAALAGFPRKLTLCADESSHGTDNLADIAARYDAINIKLDKTGGLTAALALARAAREAGLGIMVGCMVGTSLAMAPALLLAQFADYVDLDGPLLLARDREPGLHYAAHGQLFPAASALWG